MAAAAARRAQNAEAGVGVGVHGPARPAHHAVRSCATVSVRRDAGAGAPACRRRLAGRRVGRCAGRAVPTVHRPQPTRQRRAQRHLHVDGIFRRHRGAAQGARRR